MSNPIIPRTGPPDGSWPTIHGYNCPKVSHAGKDGWQHGADDDSPYFVDNVKYCGRCHSAITESDTILPELLY